MSQEKLKMIERVKKLLSLADPSRNASQDEVFEALQKARTLMAEYEISEDDITVVNPQEKRLEWEFYNEVLPTTGTTIQVWEDMLSCGVCQMTHTKGIKHRNYNKGRGYFLKIYGEKNDVQMCIALFTILRDYARKIAEYTYTTRTERRSYQEGFAVGIQEQAKTKVKSLSAEQSNRYAVVSVQKNQWVEKHVRQRFPDAKQTFHNIQGDRRAYDHGIRDGKEINTNYNQDRKALRR